MDVQKYKILYKEGEAEISEKKSRFIAHIAPAQTEEEAQALKDSIYGPVTPEVPGSILRFHPDVTIIADEAAMSLIK